MEYNCNATFSKLDISKQIEALSFNERQCIAITCFERYCRKYNISHPDIDFFIEHVWRVAQINNEFCEWADKFMDLAITGQGDPYPDSLFKVIPDNLITEFDLFTQYIYETGATCWYGAESKESSKMLLKIFEILDKHCILIPDLYLYKGGAKKSRDGWSPPISNAKLQELRNGV